MRKLKQNVKIEENQVGRIGILLSKHQWSKLFSGNPKGGLAELIRASLALNIYPLWFTEQKANQLSDCLEGVVLYDKKWRKGLYPFPEVVYDRATSPKSSSISLKEFRSLLKAKGVKFVNTRSAFPKWSTFKVLAKDESFSCYLPETLCFNKTFDLEEMLSLFPKVCVKTSGGSRGKEVLFIEREGERFVLIYPNGKKRMMSDFVQLSQAIFDFLGSKKTIIQRTIPLASISGKRFDIRILMQKVALDSWECTSALIRLADKGRQATNISLGASVLPAQHIIRELWPEMSTKILQELELVAFKTCRILEESYGSLGELGIDMAIDKNGKCWLIEVNSKPAKTTVLKCKQDELIRKAYERPLAYAQILLEET